MKKTTYLNPLDEHLETVVNRTWNAAGRCKTWDDHVHNAVEGLAAEAGEVLDVHKKLFWHKSKDRTAEIKEEIGDVCFYLAKLLELHGLSLEECLANNKVKLFERYGVQE